MRHLQFNRGKWRFSPAPAMRKAGFVGCAFDNEIAAQKKIAEYNEQWDEMRAKPTSRIDPNAGTVAWLIGRYEKDPMRYRSKSKVTQNELDYSFKIIREELGDYKVSAISRPHIRGWYNEMRSERGYSVHKAARVIKWLRALFDFAVDDLELIRLNPMARMKFEAPKPRTQIWTEAEVDRFVETCLSEYRKPGFENNQPAKPRPSIAIAVLIAWDTAQRLQDIIALKWDQFDGEGLTITQQKTGKKVWVPLDKSLDMVTTLERTSTHIVASEATGGRYKDKDEFGRIFRKWQKRAGIVGRTFHDLRRSALTDLGQSGATDAEIMSLSGHEYGSRASRIYVLPGKDAARNALRKRRTEQKH